MNKIKILFCFFTLMLGIVAVSSCGKEATISLNKDTITIAPGESFTIIAKVNKVKNPVINYDTDNPEIISLSDNVITGLLPGTASVVVSVEGEKVKPVTLSVTVSKPAPNSIEAQTSITLHLGESKKVEYSLTPSYSLEDVIFTSSAENIATVDESGNVKGISYGDAIITITSKHNALATATINVSVVPFAPSEITCVDSLDVQLHKQVQVNAKVLPAEACQDLTYEIENTAIATVTKDGKVYGKKKGSTKLIITSKENIEIKKEVIINVFAPQIKPTEQFIVKAGETINLTHTITPSIENDEVVYEAITTDLIEVTEAGVAKGIKPGSARVKVSLKDDDLIYAVFDVKVDYSDPTGFEALDKYELRQNEAVELNVKVLPATAKQGVKYSVKDSKIASITSKNILTGLTVGTTKLIIATLDDKLKIEVPLEVVPCGTHDPEFKLAEGVKKDVFVNWNKPFNPLEGITGYDADDGDITSRIVVDNPVDNQEYGLYTVVYTLKDRDNNEVTLTRKVTVGWNYDVKFIGHGGSYYGHMNSEEAILYGIRNLHYQCIEVDLKQTSDGVFVLSHGNDFADLPIHQTTWAELKDKTETYSRNKGFPSQNGSVVKETYTSKLLTLDRFLDICKEYNVTPVIELKSSAGISNSDTSRMQALMDKITAHGMIHNCILLGSQYECLIWAKTHGYEFIECQYLVGSCESQTVLDRCIKYNFNVSINVTGNYSNSVEWLAKYKEAGLKISTYTYTQYVDYDVVQSWIDKGVDYVTCDWHLMSELELPESSNVPGVLHNVKFVDYDGTVLKESTVEDGHVAAAPSKPVRKGYEFTSWDKSLLDIKEDTVFTAQYEIINYTIKYESNLKTLTSNAWATKDDFKNAFYGDMYDYLLSKAGNLTGVTKNGNAVTVSKNGVTVTFSNKEELMAIDIYDFEKSISNYIYKPVTRNSDGTCVIEEDENYFLNSSKYRLKYKDIDQWLYKCIKTSYTRYDDTYTPTSVGKIQIFFRMHQWFKGTNIPAFDDYPEYYVVTEDTSITHNIPDAPITYTILDEVILMTPTTSGTFLGWYTNKECTGEPVTKITAGTTGNIILYAKWG